MTAKKLRITSGVDQLDRLLDKIHIGDNVVWHDDAGSLAYVFCLNFIKASRAEKKPLIYVSFDRSPRNLLEKLGSLADNPYLTILDCFTNGKGAGSDVFLKFYDNTVSNWPCNIKLVKSPREMDSVMDAFYGVHETLEGDVRFVFESLTGMQELWNGEDHIINFYAHSCPRLYELNTIAYWIIEKRAHSPRLRAQINQIAQVAIDLSVKRGKTSLTILKAENRHRENLNKPYYYWSKKLNITFDEQAHTSSQINLGARLKDLRTRRGLPQTELAKLIGVTPSTISQIESGLIYPSLPALFKIAEILSVEVSSFFKESTVTGSRVVFSPAEAQDVRFSNFPDSSIKGKRLTPVDLESRAEPFLIDLPPKTKLPAHFFIHKGEEIGYLLSGKLEITIDQTTRQATAGDVILLSSEMPSQWKNPGPDTARLLWVTIR